MRPVGGLYGADLVRYDRLLMVLNHARTVLAALIDFGWGFFFWIPSSGSWFVCNLHPKAYAGTRPRLVTAPATRRPV